MQPPRVVLTRPLAQALQWQQSLQALGIEGHVLPLIEIGPYNAPAHFPHPHPLEDWPGCTALMFVSPSAVEFFWTADRIAAARSTPGPLPRLWAPGPGTAQALQQKGFAPEQIDQPAAQAAQFESESLWREVQAQITPASHVLILRGTDDESANSTNGNTNHANTAAGHGRNWLAAQIEAQGGLCTAVAVYQRQCPQWSTTTLAVAEQLRTNGSAWLFSSSQSLQHLQQLMPGRDWSRTPAVATHPRIAAKAQQMGFSPVLQSRPQLHEVAESIKSNAL